MHNFLIALIVILLYFIYLVIGFIILHVVGRNEELANWVHNAPSNLLFVLTWSLWPMVVIAYYAQFTRRTKDE